MDFDAGGCSTLKEFTVTYESQEWKFSVPCVRTGSAVEEDITLDYGAELEWTDKATPKILLTGGEGSRNYLSKEEIGTCPSGDPVDALRLGDSTSSEQYNALGNFTNEVEAVQQIKTYAESEEEWK